MADGSATHVNIRANTAYWQPDFRASVTIKGIWTATHSFLCVLNDAPTLIPQRGTRCVEPGFWFLTYDECTIENFEGDLARVICTFSGRQPPEDGQPGDTEELESDYYELQTSVTEEPIQSCPKYADLTTKEKEVIQGIIEGRWAQTIDESTGEPILYSFYNIADGRDANEYTFQQNAGMELSTKVAKGVHSYLVPYHIWRETSIVELLDDESTNTSTVPNRVKLKERMDAVGYIEQPPNAPELDGDRNYLFVGLNLTKDSRSNTATITSEWKVSGPGGWDADIYTKQN